MSGKERIRNTDNLIQRLNAGVIVQLVRLENKLGELERRLAELEEWSQYIEARLKQLEKNLHKRTRQ